MTGKERTLATMRGEEVDRVPIWLREGFPVTEGPADADDYANGWQADPAYRELFEYVAPYGEVVSGWGAAPFNRMLMIPPKYMRGEREEVSKDLIRSHTYVDTPRGELHGITEMRRGLNTGWRVKYPVESREELEKLASVPFDLDPNHITSAIESYRKAGAKLGDRGVLRMGISSPIVVISGSMPFQLFLEFSLTERKWFHELLEEITRRSLVVLEALLEAEKLDTTVNFGGSEQCTPPLMPPDAFDEYVVPYDGKVIQRLKQEGTLVNVHCHGKVSRALKCMVEMGVDASDPVEPPPAGDTTYAEAREIVGDELTIVGNLEFDELEHSEPAQIRERVKEILSFGNRRLILSSSAGPISAVTPRLADNYRTMVDAALEFGS